MIGFSRRIAAVILVLLALTSVTLACGLPVGPWIEAEEEPPAREARPTRVRKEATARPTSTRRSTFTPQPEATSTPTEPPPPPRSSLIISDWELFYNPELWEPEQGDNEWMRKLHYRAIPGCDIEANLGFGPPSYWNRIDERRDFSGTAVDVETWTDTRTGYPVLIVYEYPPDNMSHRVELMIRDVSGDPRVCVQSAEEVIRDSLP